MDYSKIGAALAEALFDAKDRGLPADKTTFFVFVRATKPLKQTLYGLNLVDTTIATGELTESVISQLSQLDEIRQISLSQTRYPRRITVTGAENLQQLDQALSENSLPPRKGGEPLDEF